MTPSPSPAPSPSSQPQSQSQSQTTSVQSTPNARPRAKKETTLFHKKPSRPFALAAMQEANGTAPAAAGSPSRVNGARAGQSAMAARSSPVPKTQGAVAGPSTSTSMASPQIPQLKYEEYQLLSTNRHEWKYNIMKFDSRRPIEVTDWARPVKLNRKEIKRADYNGGETGVAAPTPVGPMLGPDGKPVIGADGRIVMVDAEGRPIHDAKPAGPGAMKGGKDDKNKKKKFQKKTRQVFLVPDHVRKLRKEERYPWVLEDAAGKELWEGRMEEAQKSELHALFMPAEGRTFRFVPAHRWYKFQKKRPQHAWTLEEAEKMMAKMDKSKDPNRWLLRSKGGGGGGSGGPPSLVYDAGGSSLGPGGRRLRTVDSGMRGLFDEDDEEGMEDRRRRERDMGGEGDMDEMEYEDDFADDDEKIEPDGQEADEEAKELEERLKREYRNANKTREGYIDESEEEEEVDNLTGAGKDMKKLVRKIEKNAAYDSEEDKNPYASSEEEEEEEPPTPTPTGPAVQDQAGSRPGSTPGSQSKTPSRPGSKAASRSGSPAPSSAGSVKVKSEGSPPVSPVLGMGGHSVVAKRATSPKAPKLKGQSGAGSRATSPLAGGVGAGSRAGSPVSPGASRATSPAAPSKKRKAEGEGQGTSSVSGAPMGSQPKPKKRKPTASVNASTPGTPLSAAVKAEPGTEKPVATVAPGTELTAALLVAWLKVSTGATTRECIHYFQPCLTDMAKKEHFTALVKEVANLKGGVLQLKSQYRDGV